MCACVKLAVCLFVGSPEPNEKGTILCRSPGQAACGVCVCVCSGGKVIRVQYLDQVWFGEDKLKMKLIEEKIGFIVSSKRPFLPNAADWYILVLSRMMTHTHRLRQTDRQRCYSVVVVCVFTTPVHIPVLKMSRLVAWSLSDWFYVCPFVCQRQFDWVYVWLIGCISVRLSVSVSQTVWFYKE